MRIIAARKRPAAVLLAAATLWLVPEAWAQSALKSRRDIGVGDHPIGAIATDLDGDGFVDLISVNQITNSVGDVHFLKGFGDGTFRKVRTIGAGSRPSGALLGHANAD